MSEATPGGFPTEAHLFRRWFVILLVVGISALFVAMVRGLLLSLFLAAIFAGLSHPLYRWVLARVRGRATGAGCTRRDAPSELSGRRSHGPTRAASR